MQDWREKKNQIEHHQKSFKNADPRYRCSITGPRDATLASSPEYKAIYILFYEYKMVHYSHDSNIIYICKKKSNNIDPLLLKTVHIRRRHNSSFVCD